MTPADDLCQICQDNSTLILKAANLSEYEKKQRLLKVQQHFESANTQRNYNRKQVMANSSYSKRKWALCITNRASFTELQLQWLQQLRNSNGNSFNSFNLMPSKFTNPAFHSSQVRCILKLQGNADLWRVCCKK